ncbi:MAG: hypothetical protein IKQ08_03165 [Paludibacteraceae bacterium]|nr:hypothetical protein [Paludibacteraceae bacterium]
MNTSVDFVFDIAKLEGWSDNIMSVGFAEKRKLRFCLIFSNLLYVSAKSENRKRITTNKTCLSVLQTAILTAFLQKNKK